MKKKGGAENGRESRGNRNWMNQRGPGVYEGIRKGTWKKKEKKKENNKKGQSLSLPWKPSKAIN